MKKVIKLTESDLKRIVKRVINEQGTSSIPTGIMDGDEDIILLDKRRSTGEKSNVNIRDIILGVLFGLLVAYGLSNLLKRS
jgi:hypothetical protein